jgi:hypothetical protein
MDDHPPSRWNQSMKAFMASLAGLLLPCLAAAAEAVDYQRDIKPILSEHCYACHGPQKQRSGLRLDSAAAASHGGDSGPALVPGKSAESRLLQAVTAAPGVVAMPPTGRPRLTAQQIDLLRRWIDQGAKAPANEALPAAATVRSTHWAFRPPVRPAEPAVRNPAWVRNPIDRFILARLEKEGLTPSPEADRVTLLRRLSLDLLGLPPSVADVEAFVYDNRPDAYERLVDRLLSSPHYGERWGRHWLDQARYADSNGFNIDAPRQMWKYRDWVINALNRDLPFDQFTIEQLAGDLLPNATPAQKIATGFHRNTLINQEGGIDLEQFRVESIVDRVNTTGSVFLGLTIGCCQCHDHKFDPIAQREYYQLFAFLNNADEPILELPTPEQARQRARIKAEISALKQQLGNEDALTQKQLAAWELKLNPEILKHVPPEIRDILDLAQTSRDEKQKQTILAWFRQFDLARHLTGGLGNPQPFSPLAHLKLAKFRADAEKRIADLHKSEPEVVSTMVLQERAVPRMTHIHLQGDFLRKGAPVRPGVPAVLHPLRAGEKPTRLDLARWLVDPANPLTARVIMNRFWQNYFGAGLVETENDFGTQGTPPSHPDLLDWLATEFSACKWSMKAMHRLIVTSATYRQESRVRPGLAAVDPRNRLLGRQVRQRLEAEVVRDVALSASGLLAEKVGGPSVHPPQPDGVFRFTQLVRDWKTDQGEDRYRRGMYTYFWRSAPYPALTVFDAPDSTNTCTRRNRSNTPLQALTLLNDQAYFEFAQGLAGRVLREAKPSDSDRLRYAFQLCLARPPRPFEEQRLAQLLGQERLELDVAPQDAKVLAPAQHPKDADAKQLAALTLVARVLLNLDEFITRE